MSLISTRTDAPELETVDSLWAVGSQQVRTARDGMRRSMLLLADVVAVNVVLLTLGMLPEGGHLDTFLFLLIISAGSLAAACVLGSYHRDHRRMRPLTADEFPALVLWSFLVVGLVVIVLHAAGSHLPPTSATIAAIVMLALLDSTLRVTARTVWRRMTPPERVIVVGTEALSQALSRKAELFPEMHSQVISTIVPDEDALTTAHGLDRLLEQTRAPARAGAERLLIDSRLSGTEAFPSVVSICREYGLKLGLLPTGGQFIGPGVWVDKIAEMPVVHYEVTSMSIGERAVKRALDVLLAAVALVLLSPAFLVIAIMIRLDSPGPAIFRQRRAGQGGKPITVLKFRTMVSDAEARLHDVVDLDQLDDPMFKVVGDPRITRFGQVLRTTSLDELPQLLNVLRGEMSLVGIRPEETRLVDRYSPEVRTIRLANRPGITGPMQIHGRGALTFDERIAVERDYVQHPSLARDLKILVQTVGAVFSGRGAY